MRRNIHIQLLTIIGEVEGHECLPNNSKTTKYEHILPKLAVIEDSRETDGLLILLNTVGGDVEAGLAIAEMIASLSKPTVSPGTWGRPFYRRAYGCVCRLFFYCSPALPWSSTRSGATACLSVSCRPIGTWKKSRTDHQIYCRPFKYEERADRRTDVGYFPAGKRCGDHAGRRGGCTGRTDR